MPNVCGGYVNAVDTFIHEAVFLDFTAFEIRQTVEEKLAALD